MRRQLAYARYLYPDHCSFIVGTPAVPFPGTDMYRQLVSDSMITSFDWKEYGFGRSVVKTSVPPERLLKIFTGFWTGTYVRPRVALRHVRCLFSRNSFRRLMAKNYINTAVDMVKLREKTDATF